MKNLLIVFSIYLLPLFSCTSRINHAANLSDRKVEETKNLFKKEILLLSADSGLFLLMDVKTGNIIEKLSLAKADTGYLEPNTDRMFSAKSEPGTLFSPAVFMAALESGKVSEKDSFDTRHGLYEAQGIRILDSNYSAGGFGMITLADAVVKGSNIGVFRAAEEAYGDSLKNLSSCFRKMSLGEPNTESVNFQDWNWKFVPLGHDLKLSPFQLITFYNAIANNGRMVYERKVLNLQIADSGIIKAVQKVLKKNVLNGTGERALSYSVSIAGKTGSVEIRNRENNNSNPHYYQASFCGYFPADNPQYTCLVMVFNPKVEVPYGGRVAAPIFKEIAEEVMRK